jgi:murein DD-endopeptidase MepM/ murein hydrolase activator NlpD
MARHLAARALACAALLLAGAPAGAETVDLIGTWYVLVHYKDDNAPNPDEERWEDRVWVFEQDGRRLAWKEYPIVVFDDETGRFERRHTGQYARILHHWEPSPAQQADIADGLQVNSRGAKQKTLRGSDAGGWSSGRSAGAASASVVSYQEVWSIEGLPSLPVFTRSDVLGGGSADDIEGVTQYTTTRVEGGVVSGSFERDGTRHGTFRMMRSGEVGAVKGAASQQELQEKAFRRTLEDSSSARAETVQQVKDMLEQAGAGLPDDDLEQIANETLALYLDGVPREEVQRRMRERLREKLTGFATTGATHDDSVRYRWPFDSKQPRQLLQGVRGDTGGPMGELYLGFRRRESNLHTFDFELPVGTPVLAARGGVVVRVVDGKTKSGQQQGMGLETNLVVILHDDGTFATYKHLEPGIAVSPKQRVETGEKLGSSGKTGQVTKPELGFVVQRLTEEGEVRSVEIRFDDGSAEGVVPVAGAHYGGGG